MHKASIVLAAGADFRLLGPRRDDARAPSKPVVAVCAVRTGCGKSQTSRKVGADAARRRAARSRSSGIRCRTATSRRCACSASRRSTDIDASRSDRRGARGVRGAGADGHGHVRRRRLRGDPRARPRRRPTSIIWDGGNNDFPFYRARPADRRRRPAAARARAALPPRRDEPAHGRRRRDQQGRLAPTAHDVEPVLENVERVNPLATVVFAESPPRARRRPAILRQARARRRRRADAHARRDAVRRRARRGPQTPARRRSSTRGRTRSARSKDVFAKWPQLTNVLPAMGYSRRAAARARADDQRGRLRRRRHRHADRPRPADPTRGIRSATCATSSRRSARRRSPTCSQPIVAQATTSCPRRSGRE